MADNKKNTPSPINTMLYFLFLTIFYAIIYVYTISNSQDMNDTVKNSKNTIINLIYSLLLLSGLFFLNLKTSKQICPGSENFQYYNVLIYTIIPWLLIYGILYLLLDLFPGWSKPFSNTLGYIIVNFIGAEKLLNNFLEDKIENKESNLVNAIAKIGSNKSMFINQFSHVKEDFDNFFSELQKSGIFKNENDDNDDNDDNDNEKTEFFKLITIKHIIGKLVWYILAGTLIASISFNYLIQMRCDNDIYKVNQDINKFYDDNKLTPDGSYWEVYIETKPSIASIALYDYSDDGIYQGKPEFKQDTGKYNGLIQYLNNIIKMDGNEMTANTPSKLENERSVRLTFDALRNTKILQYKYINLNDYIKIKENVFVNGSTEKTPRDFYFIAKPNPDDE